MLVSSLFCHLGVLANGLLAACEDALCARQKEIVIKWSSRDYLGFPKTNCAGKALGELEEVLAPS